MSRLIWCKYGHFDFGEYDTVLDIFVYDIELSLCEYVTGEISHNISEKYACRPDLTLKKRLCFFVLSRKNTEKYSWQVLYTKHNLT